MDTGLGLLKLIPQKLIHKTGAFLGNKIAGAVTKLNDEKIINPDENSRNVKR